MNVSLVIAGAVILSVGFIMLGLNLFPANLPLNILGGFLLGYGFVKKHE